MPELCRGLYYLKAIRYAKKSKFTLDLAIAHEQLSNYYQTSHQMVAAEKHRKKAIFAYEAYGALAKTKL
jgi:hypothetical protein